MSIGSRVVNSTETVLGGVGGRSPASSAANGPRLNSQLTAEEIVNGHAYDKHIGEFADLGISTREQLQSHVEHVLENPTDIRYYSDNRTVYIDRNSNTVVIRNGSNGESTTFRPDEWDRVIRRLPIRNVPY